MKKLLVNLKGYTEEKLIKALKEIPTVKETNSYKPVQMFAPVEALLKAIEELGEAEVKVAYVELDFNANPIKHPYLYNELKNIEIKSIRPSALNKIHTLVAKVVMEPVDGEEFSKAVYVINNSTKKHAVTYAVGYNMNVCENGTVFGAELLRKRRHTGSRMQTVLDMYVEEVMMFLIGDTSNFKEFMYDLMSTELTRTEQNNFIGNMFDVFPTRINTNVLKYRDSKHCAFKDNTLFDVYNWYTEAFKDVVGYKQVKLFDMLTVEVLKAFRQHSDRLQ